MTDTNETDNTQAASGSDTDPASVDPLMNRLPEFADWLPDSISPYWELIAQYPLLGAFVIAVLFFLLAFFIRGVIIRSIATLAANTETELDNRAISGLRQPIFNAIFLFGLSLAVKSANLPMGTDFLVNVVLSMIVVTLMRAAFFLSNELLHALALNHHRFSAIEQETVPLFNIIIKLLIILFGSYVLLMIWGVNPVGWLASAGIVGIAVGFAAQDTLANLFAGFFVLVDKTYQLGHYVTLDSGERGQVTHVGMRSTRILTRDDVEITIPNAVMGNAKIINESGGPYEKMRVRISVGAAYGSDVHQITDVLEQIAYHNHEVCKQPAPRVRMRAFGESSLDFELLAWIERPEDRGRISHDLYMQVYDGFNAAGIEIPYAKRDLYIKEMPGTGANPDPNPDANPGARPVNDN